MNVRPCGADVLAERSEIRLGAWVLYDDVTRRVLNCGLADKRERHQGIAHAAATENNRLAAPRSRWVNRFALRLLGHRPGTCCDRAN